MRRAGRVDANQQKVVKQLRNAGLSVRVTSMLGDGFPDLIVADERLTILVELKDGDKPASQRKLTPDEIEFHNTWKGKIYIATDAKFILTLFDKI